MHIAGLGNLLVRNSDSCVFLLRLKDAICADKFKYLDIKAQLSEFPKSITLSQIVAVWKYIAKSKNNIKKD